MFLVDTNVLVYSANQDVPEHRRCHELLERWRRGSESWCTTWSVIYEFLRVVSHPRVLPHPWSAAESWRFVTAILSSPSHRVLVATDRHQQVAAQTLEELPELRGNLLHDAHTAILMREHRVDRIYTRDSDFRRFPFLEVVDPFEAEQ